jgi:two-component system, chemotaxis family, protein-glutamate methylesterase/glutaminase
VRILVADDSVVFRRVLTDVLGALPDVEVVGQVPNGKMAVQKVAELRPDLLTLDMEMPEMDGLSVLDALKAAGTMPAVIVVSSLTKQGGWLTMQALQKGAFDFVTKPDTTNAEASRKAMRDELAPRLRALGMRLGVQKILRPTPAAGASATAANPAEKEVPVRRPNTLAKPEMLLMGVSTGGPNALGTLIPTLPVTLGIPIFLVQHMPPIFTHTLAESLNAKSALTVREAVDGESAEPNHVYIAPGGRQMRIAAGQKGRPQIQITDDPPENNCRPSVDYLFRSAAHHFPGKAMAVILTGMGSDGTLGLRLLKRHGCFVLAQDEASCVVYGMPKAAVDAGVTDAVLPLDRMAAGIVAGCSR